MVLDKKMLAESIEKVPEFGEEERNQSSMLRQLLLVIAGDRRMIDRMSLEDMKKLFSMSTWILRAYAETTDYYFEERRLVTYAGCRRAV